MKKVGIQLPRQANPEAVEIRYSLELEALSPIAEIIEVDASTPEEFAEGVKDMDAIITSWGFRIDAELISKLNKCVVIGVGSVGVDMVDIEAATAAGIVVTNVPDVFIEEVADHAMMMLLAAGRRMKLMNRMAAEGNWWHGRPILSEVPRLYGQTLGLLAFGNVSRCMARRAKDGHRTVVQVKVWTFVHALGQRPKTVCRNIGSKVRRKSRRARLSE